MNTVKTVQLPNGRVIRLFSADLKKSIVKDFENYNGTLIDYVKQWNIQRSLFYHWKNQIKNKIPLHDDAGCPPLFNDEDLAILNTKVDTDNRNGAPVTVEEFGKGLFDITVKKRAITKQNVIVLQHDPKTVEKYIKECGLKSCNAQEKSSARLQAESDIFNALSTIILFCCIAKIVKHVQLIFNFDATTFEILNTYQKSKRIVVSRSTNAASYVPSINTERCPGCFYLKYYSLIGADGTSCPWMVFIVADNTLDKNDFFCYRVDMLSCLQVVGAYGYICIMKDRGGNKKFFDWWYRTIICLYVQLVKDSSALENDSYAAVSCDGEALQIYPAMETPIQDALNENKIILCKLAASTTAISQPNDAYKFFSCAKANVKKVTDQQIDMQLGLRNKLVAMFDQYETDRNIINPSNWGRYRAKAITAILKCKIALHATLNHADIITKSFLQVGISQDTTCNYTQVLNQYHIPAYYGNDVTIQNAITDTNGAIGVFMKNGSITDSQLYYYFKDMINDYSQGDAYVNREGVVLSHQRCVILNHATTVQLYLDKIQAKADAELRKEQEAIARKERQESEKLQREMLAEARELKRQEKRAREEQKEEGKRAKAAEKQNHDINCQTDIQKRKQQRKKKRRRIGVFVNLVMLILKMHIIGQNAQIANTVMESNGIIIAALRRKIHGFLLNFGFVPYVTQ